MLRRLVATALVAALAAACGGDDGDRGGDGGGDREATETSSSAVTDPAQPGEPSGDCDVIQVLLKLDVTDEQREDVASVLDGIEGVSHELVEASSDTEPSVFLVTAETDAASDAVGGELSGHPAVVSVVFPEQLC